MKAAGSAALPFGCREALSRFRFSPSERVLTLFGQVLNGGIFERFQDLFGRLIDDSPDQALIRHLAKRFARFGYCRD